MILFKYNYLSKALLLCLFVTFSVTSAGQTYSQYDPAFFSYNDEVIEFMDGQPEIMDFLKQRPQQYGAYKENPVLITEFFINPRPSNETLALFGRVLYKPDFEAYIKGTWRPEDFLPPSDLPTQPSPEPNEDGWVNTQFHLRLDYGTMVDFFKKEAIDNIELDPRCKNAGGSGDYREGKYFCNEYPFGRTIEGMSPWQHQYDWVLKRYIKRTLTRLCVVTESRRSDLGTTPSPDGGDGLQAEPPYEIITPTTVTRIQDISPKFDGVDYKCRSIFKKNIFDYGHFKYKWFDIDEEKLQIYFDRALDRWNAIKLVDFEFIYFDQILGHFPENFASLQKENFLDRVQFHFSRPCYSDEINCMDPEFKPDLVFMLYADRIADENVLKISDLDSKKTDAEIILSSDIRENFFMRQTVADGKYIPQICTYLSGTKFFTNSQRFGINFDDYIESPEGNNIPQWQVDVFNILSFVLGGVEVVFKISPFKFKFDAVEICAATQLQLDENGIVVGIDSPESDITRPYVIQTPRIINPKAEAPDIDTDVRFGLGIIVTDILEYAVNQIKDYFLIDLKLESKVQEVANSYTSRLENSEYIREIFLNQAPEIYPYLIDSLDNYVKTVLNQGTDLEFYLHDDLVSFCEDVASRISDGGRRSVFLGICFQFISNYTYSNIVGLNNDNFCSLGYARVNPPAVEPDPEITNSTDTGTAAEMTETTDAIISSDTTDTGDSVEATEPPVEPNWWYHTGQCQVGFLVNALVPSQLLPVLNCFSEYLSNKPLNGEFTEYCAAEINEFTLRF